MSHAVSLYPILVSIQDAWWFPNYSIQSFCREHLRNVLGKMSEVKTSEVQMSEVKESEEKNDRGKHESGKIGRGIFC